MSTDNKVARQLDSFVPTAPVVPEPAPSIIQEQAIGGPAWQDQKVVRDEQRVDRAARVAGAKARELAERQMTAGSAAFGDRRSDQNRTVRMEDPETGEVREYRIAVRGENERAEADRKLLEEEEARLAAQRGVPLYQPREAGKKPEPMARATPEEVAARVAAIPRIVMVTVPEAYEMGPERALVLAQERLIEAGADLSKGAFRMYHNPSPRVGGMIAEWREHGS